MYKSWLKCPSPCENACPDRLRYGESFHSAFHTRFDAQEIRLINIFGVGSVIRIDLAGVWKGTLLKEDLLQRLYLRGDEHIISIVSQSHR